MVRRVLGVFPRVIEKIQKHLCHAGNINFYGGQCLLDAHGHRIPWPRSLGVLRTATPPASPACPFPDCFVARLDKDGSLIWVKTLGGPEIDWMRGLSVAPDRSIALVGAFGGRATFGAGEAGQTTLKAVGYSDLFVARLAPGGNLRSVDQAGGPIDDLAQGVACLGSGVCFLTGAFKF